MNHRKKRTLYQLFTSLLLLILFSGAPMTAHAAASVKAEAVVDITIVVDGKQVGLGDSVRKMDDRLFLPAASLADIFGAKVEWDQDHEKVTIHTTEGNQIVLGNGVPVVYFNESRYMMDVAPFIENGRTYLSIRTLADLLRTTVKWYEDEQLVELLSVPLEEEFIPAIFENEAEPFTEDDLMLLAKITQVESGYESYEGQLAVANVILNRVKDPKFPNSIKEVIYSGKQFPPAHNGLLDKSKPNESVLRAVKDALNGKNNVEDAVYFFNPKVSKDKFWKSLTVITTIGVHSFAK